MAKLLLYHKMIIDCKATILGTLRALLVSMFITSLPICASLAKSATAQSSSKSCRQALTNEAPTLYSQADRFRERVPINSKISIERAKLTEFAEHLESTFHNKFPARPHKFKEDEFKNYSLQAHTLILQHFDMLKQSGWPYEQTLTLFALVTEYNDLKINSDLHKWNNFFRVADHKKLPAKFWGKDDQWLESSLINYSKFIIIPTAGLSSFEDMNWLAARGIHVAVVENKRSIIDNKPRTPGLAYRHDFAHYFLVMIPPSDLNFWEALVDAINTLPNDKARKYFHAYFFIYWHEHRRLVDKSSIIVELKHIKNGGIDYDNLNVRQLLNETSMPAKYQVVNAVNQLADSLSIKFEE